MLRSAGEASGASSLTCHRVRSSASPLHSSAQPLKGYLLFTFTRSSRHLLSRRAPSHQSSSSRSSRLISSLLVCFIALSAGACEQFYGFFIGEPRADIDHPQRHSDERVQFQYPGNWKLALNRQDAGGQTIVTRNISSHGSAVTIIQSFPPFVPVPLDAYLENFIKGMSNELDSGWTKMLKHTQQKATRIKRKVFGAEHEGRRFTWEISVLNEKVPFVIEIINATTPQGSVYVITQLPIEGADKARPGANLVLDSLKLTQASK